MKLLRWGPKGAEKPGMLDGETIRDLSGVIDDLSPATVTLESLAKLRELDPAALPAVSPDRIGACLSRVETFHAIGLNYRLHADETGNPWPKEPIVFAKAASCLAGPDDALVIPRDSVKTDWEVELGVVIGRVAEHVSEAEALSCIAGYCVANDVSEREWQQERGGTWCKGKGAPGFGPLGPWLVTADEVPDPQALPIWLKLNGETVQASTTADMIFSVAEIVSYLSRFVRLVPGDVIVTGTPSGVGLGMKPPRFLAPGDTLELGIEGLGVQHQTAVAYPG